MRKIASRFSVCLTVRMEQFAPTGRIFMKFDICAYLMENETASFGAYFPSPYCGRKKTHNFNIQKPTVSI